MDKRRGGGEGAKKNIGFGHAHGIKTVMQEDTVLPNGVKVAVRDQSQKCQKLTKVGLTCSLGLYWMYFFKKWLIFLRKVLKLVQNTSLTFWIFCYLCLFTSERSGIFTFFLLLREVCWVMSAIISTNQIRNNQKINLDSI